MGQETPPAGEHASEDPRGSGRVVPFSCSTNLAKDTLRQMRRAKLSREAYDFLLLMHDQTFGNAGFQKRAKKAEPGIWAEFSVGAWAREYGDPDIMCRIRDRLADRKIIVYAPRGRGKGLIGWNLNFDQWEQYDNRGGKRAGTGAPKGNQNASKTIKTSEEEDGATDSADELQGRRKTIKKSEDSIKKSEETIKRSETTSDESGNEAASEGAEEYGRMEEETVPNGTGASAPNDSPSSSPLPATEATSIAPAEAEADPPIAARLPKPAKAGKGKLSGAALEAHNRKAQYKRVLVEELQLAYGGELPSPKEQFGYAEWFYTLKTGPAPIEDVTACFVATLPDPLYERTPPTVRQLQGHYTSWLRNGSAAYIKSVQDKRKRTDWANEGKPSARAGAAATSFTPASYD